jgi:hypothetical protein
MEKLAVFSRKNGTFELFSMLLCVKMIVCFEIIEKYEKEDKLEES